MKVFHSKVFRYIIFKYFSFFLIFFNSLIVAKLLGVYYFGIYSFSQMVLQYLLYSNLGVNYAYSVIASDKVNQEFNSRNEISHTALKLTILFSSFLILLYFFLKDVEIFSKYDFNDYFSYVLVIGVLQNFNTLFLNVFRVFNKYKIINFYYLAGPLFQSILLLCYRGENLFYNLFNVTIFANIVSFLFFLIKYPSLKSFFSTSLFNDRTYYIFKRGVFLLFYNMSFYGILLCFRSIISNYFITEDFALYNFGYNLSNAISLLLGSIVFLFYPKLINSISNISETSNLLIYIEKIRILYLTLTTGLIFFSLFFLPILFKFIPNYTESLVYAEVMLLAQLLLSNSFGVTTLLVQRGKEFELAIAAVLTITFLLVASSFFIKYFDYSLLKLCFILVLSLIIYNFLIFYILGKNIGLSCINRIFIFKLFMPVICYIFLRVVMVPFFFTLIISMVIYFLLNLNELKVFQKKSMSLLKNDKYLKI